MPPFPPPAIRDFGYLLQQRDAAGRVPPPGGAPATAAGGDRCGDGGSGQEAAGRDQRDASSSDAGGGNGTGGGGAKRQRVGDPQRLRAPDGTPPAADPSIPLPPAAAPAPSPDPEPPPPAPPDGPAGELQRGLSALLAARRLVLVLDLDHTLVNSARFGEVAPEVEYRLQGMLVDQVGGG